VGERAPVQVESRLERSAEEPGQPGQRHEGADTALRPAVPCRDATHKENRTDGEVFGRERGVVLLEGHPFGRDSEGDPDQENRQPKPTLCSAERFRHCLPRELAFWDEAPGGMCGQSAPERGDVAARDEDDRGRDAVGRESLRHRKPVEVRQMDVEQHDLRTQFRRGGDRGRSVFGFADHLEISRLEECARRSSEGGMIVNDQHRPAHLANSGRGRPLSHQCPP
jgi:hypothetical protein